MSSVVRKVKATIYARAHAAKRAAAEQAADQNNFVNNSQANDNGQPAPVTPKDTSNYPTNFYPSSSTRNRKSRFDLSAAVKPTFSIRAHKRHSEKQSPPKQLHRHLIRKASTVKLHFGRLGGVSATTASHPRREHLFLDAESSYSDSDGFASKITAHQNSPTAPQPTRLPTASSHYLDGTEPVEHCQVCTDNRHCELVSGTLFNTDHISPEKEVGNYYDLDAIVFAQPHEHTKQSTDSHSHIQNEMAITPPLPYEILKKITVDACETALSNVTAYDHPKTESWNTSIINTILAQLVGETSGSSDSAASAPKYKFVVNSTIVQHRNSMSENGGGRRGMHSAAGAYWNNEKDGMWSFKYDAGDSKGLDVVVGIVWVWVG